MLGSLRDGRQPGCLCRVGLSGDSCSTISQWEVGSLAEEVWIQQWWWRREVEVCQSG
jgi:hypothetical protein